LADIVAGVRAAATGLVGRVDPDGYLPVPFLTALVRTALVSVRLTGPPAQQRTPRAATKEPAA
jgi:hypothetical protein